MLRRRRLLAALAVGGAVAAGVQATTAPPAPSARVWVAARDLPAGTTLAADDLEEREFAPGSVPAGVAHSSPTGGVLAAPVRSGEPVTDVRLWDDELVSAYPDRVAVPVRLPDPAAVALLAPGDVLDLWATDPQGGGTDLVVAGARVVAVPGTDGSGPEGALTGRLVVLAVPSDVVNDTADAAAQDFLSFSLAPLQ